MPLAAFHRAQLPPLLLPPELPDRAADLLPPELLPPTLLPVEPLETPSPPREIVELPDDVRTGVPSRGTVVVPPLTVWPSPPLPP